MRAWGELAYLEPLTEKQMEGSELRPAPGNPDWAAQPAARRLPRSPTRPNTTSPMSAYKEDTMNKRDNHLHTAEFSEE